MNRRIQGGVRFRRRQAGTLAVRLPVEGVRPVPAGCLRVETKRGLALPLVRSALATTRRERPQRYRGAEGSRESGDAACRCARACAIPASTAPTSSSFLVKPNGRPAPLAPHRPAVRLPFPVGARAAAIRSLQPRPPQRRWSTAATSKSKDDDGGRRAAADGNGHRNSRVGNALPVRRATDRRLHRDRERSARRHAQIQPWLLPLAGEGREGMPAGTDRIDG